MGIRNCTNASRRPKGELVELLRRAADTVDDGDQVPRVQSPLPGDDYLIIVGVVARAVIVSGDNHLLGLADDLPVYSPNGFLELLDAHHR